MISETLFTMLIWSVIGVGWIGFAIIAISLVRDGFLTTKGRTSRDGKEADDGASSR